MENQVTSAVWEDTQNSEEFIAHRKRYRSFAFPVAVGFLVWYFAFILLATFARDFMTIFVFGNINVALLLAVGQFISTFVLAWLYDRFSTKNLDGPSAELKAKVESELYR